MGGGAAGIGSDSEFVDSMWNPTSDQNCGIVMLQRVICRSSKLKMASSGKLTAEPIFTI